MCKQLLLLQLCLGGLIYINSACLISIKLKFSTNILFKYCNYVNVLNSHYCIFEKLIILYVLLVTIAVT